MYRLTLTPDDNGTLLVTCPDLPEVATFGEDEEEAIGRAADAIEEALAARMSRREEVPTMPHWERPLEWVAAREKEILAGSEDATPAVRHRVVLLPPLTIAKVELYRAMRAGGVSKAELARRLGWRGPQVDRLLDLNYSSTFENLDRASRAIGKRLRVSVEDTA